MKKHLNLLILLFISICLLTTVGFAQAPNGFNYQAAIRNSDGTIKNSEQVTLQFSILQSSVNGTVLYRETAVETTDQYGLVEHVIGSGTVVSGSMSTINWGNGAKYLKIELNVGSGFITVSNQKLQSVPYALFAANATSGTTTTYWDASGPNISNKNSGYVGIGVSSPSELLEMSRTNTNNYIRINSGNGTSRYAGIKLFEPNISHGWLMRMNAGSDHLSFGHQEQGGSIKEQLTLLKNGNIGIGTSQPLEDLQIGSLTRASDGYLSIKTKGGPGLYKAGIKLQHSNSNFGFSLVSEDIGSNTTFNIYSHNGPVAKNAFSIDRASGFIGIGNQDPTAPLEISQSTGAVGLIITEDVEIGMYSGDDFEIAHISSTGSIVNRRFKIASNGNVTAGTTLLHSSDRRFKKEITPIRNVLATLAKLEGVYYQWDTESYPGRFEAGRAIGVIAQELQQYYPEIVREDEEGFLAVDYTKIGAILIQGINEQQLLIEDSNSKLDQLEKKNVELENRLLELELAIEKLNQDK